MLGRFLFRYLPLFVVAATGCGGKANVANVGGGGSANTGSTDGGNAADVSDAGAYVCGATLCSPTQVCLYPQCCYDCTNVPMGPPFCQDVDGGTYSYVSCYNDAGASVILSLPSGVAASSTLYCEIEIPCI
jgi:hypothetical protein